jgi:oligopeptide/dipeptide ABC transporter ATP-binding protein
MLQGDVPSPFNPSAGCRFHARCAHAQARCSAEEPNGDGANGKFAEQLAAFEAAKQARATA